MGDVLDVIDRIERCQSEQGLTQRALAEMAGLSVTQMNRIMTRQRKLTASELGMLADALGVSASELLGDAGRRLSVAARVGSAERAPELEGPFKRAEMLLKTRELLDAVVARPEPGARPELPAPNPSTMHKTQGRTLAVALRREVGLGDGEPVGDLEALAARFGLDVSTQPLPEKLHGLLVADQGVGEQGGARVAVALLNGNDTAGRRRFTLAHELGHLLFGDASLAIADYAPNAAHKDGRWTLERLAELRADVFAAHLLAPDSVVRAIAVELGEPGRTKAAWASRLMVEVALRCGISFETAGNRARDAKALTEDERAEASARGAYQAFRDAGRSEAQGQVLDTVMGVEPPVTMVDQALTAYQHEMLGLRPVATLYDVRDSEMDNLRTQLWDAGWVPASAL